MGDKMADKASVADAERQIAEILARLESERDSYVEYLGVQDLEITNIGDDRPIVFRRVVITLKRRPGTEWSI